MGTIKKYGAFLFKYRNYIFLVASVLLFFGFEPVSFAGNKIINLWLNSLGLTIISIGLIIRAAVIGLAYIKRGGLNKKVYAETLVTTGLFAHCRNPLYLGNILIITGLFIVHNNPWVYLIGFSFFLFSYYSIIIIEEDYLLNKFGIEFEEYCKNTSRLLINTKGLKQTLTGMKFNWKRVIAKDYTTIATALITYLLLLAEEHIYLSGFDASQEFLRTITIYTCLIIVLIATVKICKKIGMFSE